MDEIKTEIDEIRRKNLILKKKQKMEQLYHWKTKKTFIHYLLQTMKFLLYLAFPKVPGNIHQYANDGNMYHGTLKCSATKVIRKENFPIRKWINALFWSIWKLLLLFSNSLRSNGTTVFNFFNIWGRMVSYSVISWSHRNMFTYN